MTNCLLLLAALILQDSGSGMAVNANERVCYGFSMNYIIDCRYSLNRKCNYAMRHAGLSRYPPDMSLMLLFSFPQSFPPSLCPCPSINEALPLSPALQNLLPGSNSLGETRDAPLAALMSHTSAAESTSSRDMPSLFLSFRDLFQVCLAHQFWLFSESFPASFFFPPLASTISYVTPQTPVTTHRCTPGPLSLLQMSSTMEHECFKQPNNWATAPCPIVAQDSNK